MSTESQIGFERLIRPLDVRDFFEKYWEQCIHHSTGGVSDIVESLVSVDDVKSLIGTLTVNDADWFQLRKAGEPRLPESKYLTEDGYVDADKVFALYADGYSITLAKMHNRWPPVADLCRSVEQSLTELGLVLKDRVGSHLYLTPPGNRAVLPHYDDLNVIALQVEGEKDWSLYEMLEPFPVAPQKRVTNEEDLPPLICETRLRKGDLLYIPRGFYHQAKAATTLSMHLTLDIYTRTWADLIAAMAIDSPPLRRSILDSEIAGVADRIESYVRTITSSDLSRYANALVADFVDGLDVLPENGFHQVALSDSISLSTCVERRRGAFLHLSEHEDDFQMRFPGGGFKGPREIRPVYEFLNTVSRFRVGALPALADESKIHVVSELVRDGFLKIVGG